jgi:enoyl-[acyl-carrier protein] reductase/trans-2-enoyl-CoA reductase (NAD+)
MQEINGCAYVSVNKAVVTQASSAIPVVPLYNSLLFKVLKEKGLQEGCTEQIQRLFAERLYNGSALQLDSDSRIRIDDLEMREDVQHEIKKIWPQLSTENLYKLTDYESYSKEFLKLFGFGIPGVDYEVDTEIELELS